MAYSFSKPVIATNVGDFTEAVEQGRSGFIISEKTPECLSEAIITAVKDLSSLKIMGEYSGVLNETKYSWSDISLKTLDIYNRM
jgi:glycosyltransferase involved in cell wall biosynthesis